MLFYQKLHKSPSFTCKSFHKHKKKYPFAWKSLKRATFTHIFNINEIKNQPFVEMKSAKTKKDLESAETKRRRQSKRARQ